MNFVILQLLIALTATANQSNLIGLKSGRVKSESSHVFPTLKKETEVGRAKEFKISKNESLKKQPKLNDRRNQRIGGGGVDGGGGGNVRPSKPFLKKDLENFLNSNSVRIALRLLFNDALNFKGKALFKTDPEETYCSEMPQCMEEYIKIHKLNLSLNEKLLYQDRNYNIFDSIKSARFYAQDEPCIDPITKKEMDAAAYKHNKSICFSYNRLKGKISHSDLDDRLFMLLIHEITHLHLATEEEALAVEAQIGEWSSFHDLSSDINLATSHYGHDIAKSWLAVNDVLNNFDRYSGAQLCLKLTTTSRRLTELNNSGDQILGENSMALHSPAELAIPFRINFRKLNLVVYCLAEDLPWMIDEIRDDFSENYEDNLLLFEKYMNAFPAGSKEQEITMKEYLRRVFGEESENFDEVVSGFIQNTRIRQNVKNELMELRFELNHEKQRFEHIFGYDPVKLYLEMMKYRTQEN